MNIMKKHLIIGLLGTAMFTTAALPAADGHDHEAAAEAHEHGEEGHEEENAVHLKADQLEAAGIQVETLQPRPVPEEVEAPGEVLLNLYATSQVTPRIAAQVVQRHAKLGDQVTKGQVLVTLSSAEMADAQGALIIAAKEWQRVKKLGLQVVSGAMLETGVRSN
ncbi:efflux RND transporter periplasmic adaptor subunit [Thiolapillus brandeum]|uniref:efflux RND transporter periplasmic adaptor subunit n=1 Tax=Thiolapillus brandeum TaxID=1076588 RepID=UPI000596DC22|nr:efflux RND transporter periplasmic adaptor subunit [Thiolapillus brandeum]